MPSRLACLRCEVLTTDDANAPCWSCGGPLISAVGFQNPASPPMRNPMLAALADETP